MATHNHEIDLFVGVFGKRTEVQLFLGQAFERQGQRMRWVGPKLVEIRRIGLKISYCYAIRE